MIGFSTIRIPISAGESTIDGVANVISLVWQVYFTSLTVLFYQDSH